jgi:hypothetical protein
MPVCYLDLHAQKDMALLCFDLAVMRIAGSGCVTQIRYAAQLD